MKNKALIITLILGAFSLSAFGKVDCDDPKNRPRAIAGILTGGHKDCYRKNNAKDTKLDLEMTIGRNPVTGKITSKAELAGADNPTMNLETAQMNFGKAEQALKDAEEAYEGDRSTKNSRRVDKARKAFKQAQLDLEAAEEIKEKADKKKGK
mgnify:FL=1